MKKFIILIVIINVISACSKDFHLKRSKNHYDKAIKAGHSVEIDTINITDTIYLPSIRVDTLIRTLSDTITIEKEKIRVKILTRPDSIFVQAECLPDTLEVIRTQIIECDPIYIEVEKPGIIKIWFTSLKWYEKLATILGAIFGLVLILLIIFAKFIK